MSIVAAIWEANVPVGRLTSLKVGGSADLFAAPRRLEDLRACLTEAARADIPVTVIGGGSNLLISDGGIAGLVIRPSDTHVSIEDRGESALVTAGAATNLAALARRLARAGWTGLEWASNVPGTVGGAVVNNAGAFGSCVEEWLDSAEVLLGDLSVKTLLLPDLDYAYRTSVLKTHRLSPALVLRATFRVHRGSAAEAVALVKELQKQRTETQPRILSAGSVFANPPGDYSGRLIELAGLKGYRRGDAEISTVHANFIVNHGKARATDVYGLMREAQDRVWNTNQVWLHPEIELVGRWTVEQRSALQAPERAA